MTDAGWPTAAFFAADWIVRIGLSLRVVMRRPPVGVALAWLLIILSTPLVGVATYILFGELRLGRQRAARSRAIHGPYRRWLQSLRDRYALDTLRLDPESAGVSRLVEVAIGQPAFPDNELTLLTDAESIFRSLIADVESARRTCHLEFYIWSDGGLADELAEAVLRASGRGVVCRVARRCGRQQGVPPRPDGRAAPRRRRPAPGRLPVSLIRALFVRFDLRLHRKIVVIDGEVAYTGSQNVADPRYFKQSSGVGSWVDAMVRLRGPAVEGLAITFLEDWELETGDGLDALADSHDIHHLPAHGLAVVQVAPSGPNLNADTMLAVLLETLYSARHEVVLTTPYFVPDDSLLLALTSAAGRGVTVTLVLPARNDSKLVDLASRAFQGDLAEAGVQVCLFDAGLLHTKSITVDGRFSLFGSLNLDPRSLQLNFEVTLAVYDRDFTAALLSLQQTYLDRSRPLDLPSWLARPLSTRLAENAARLLGPLL